MLADTSKEDFNYVGSMDDCDRIETESEGGAAVSHSQRGVPAADTPTKNSTPFARSSLNSLFPQLGSGISGEGLDAPELDDIKGLDLQAPDIIELLDDENNMRRRSLSETAAARPSLEQPMESMSQRTVVFTREELLGLRLMFSLFDRTGNGFIEYEDLVAYAEETGDFLRLRDASLALDILDIDGDGCIGLLDFIHFASRLQSLYAEGMLNISNKPGGENGVGETDEV